MSSYKAAPLAQGGFGKIVNAPEQRILSKSFLDLHHGQLHIFFLYFFLRRPEKGKAAGDFSCREYIVKADPDDPDAVPPGDLVPIEPEEGFPYVRWHVGVAFQPPGAAAAPSFFIRKSYVQGNAPGHESFFQQLLYQDFHHFKEEELPLFPGVIFKEYLAVADGPLRWVVAVDIGNGAGLLAMGVVDEALRIDSEFPIQQFFRQEGGVVEVIGPVFSQPAGDAGTDIPDVRNGPVVLDFFFEPVLVQKGDVLRQVLGQDIHAHLGQKKVGSHAGGGADAGPVIHGVHGHPGNADAVPAVEFPVRCYIDETFVDGIGVDVFCRKQGKVGMVDVGGHVHVQFHPGQRCQVGQGGRNLIEPASVPYALFLQRWTHRQAESAGPPGRIRHHQVRSKGIQPPGGTLHGGIETLEIDAHVHTDFCKELQ